jgi:hypothetical protein
VTLFNFFPGRKPVKPRYPQREYDALISTALLLTSELQEFIDRYRRSPSPMVSHDEVERFILQLQDIDLKAKQHLKDEY